MADDGFDTSNWNPLGEVYYRKLELYSMFWIDRVDLSKYIVSAGIFGGPIALVKDDVMSSGGSIRPVVHIFTASGQEQAAFKWDGSRLIEMGWSISEELICVAEDGAVYVHDMFGAFQRQFSLGLEVQRSYIVKAQIFSSNFGTGICALSGDYQFFLVNNIGEVKLKRIQNPFNLDAPPSSWAVVCSPDEPESKVLMAVDRQIYEMDPFNSKLKEPEINQQVNSFIQIVVSFNQKYVAMFADTGLLWIGSSDLNKVYSQYNTQVPQRPIQLVWCGSGAVVGYWDGYLMVVGPTQDSVKYFVQSKVHLVQEVDGVRIIGNRTQDFLQKVPAEVEDILKLGSMKPGAILIDASREFHQHSHKVDDYLRNVKDHLHEAVTECIKAAGHEFDEKHQTNLIRAAGFGKCYVQDMRPQAFVEMSKTIRVLNNIRDFKISIPITYEQLQRLTLPVLIDRLIARRFFYLAIKICKYLKIPKADGESRVLAHWACYKVQQDTADDDKLAKEIAEKLGDTEGISYTEIATKAFERGKTALAIKLLDYEPRTADQVPLLMRMNKIDIALQKAVSSGETELVYIVTEHMRKDLDQREFLMKIRTFPTALSLLIKRSKTQDRSTLFDIYDQDDKFQEKANVYIEDSYGEKELNKRMKMLCYAKEAFNNGQYVLKAQMTEENIRLLELENKLQETYGKPFMNLSVSDLLYQLIYQGLTKPAEKLRKDFQIPDVRYWWTKIQALGAARDWTELENFSKNKKSPIGYVPFVEICCKYNNFTEAEKYIMKVPVEKRVKLFLKTGNLKKAAEVAFQLKSLDDLNLVASKGSNNRSLQEDINAYRAQLSQGDRTFSLPKGLSIN